MKAVFVLRLIKVCSVLCLAACFVAGPLFRPAAAFQLFANVNGKPYAWDLAKGPIRWTVHPGAPATVRESMAAVTAVWSQVTQGAVQFSESSESAVIDGVGVIDIYWDAEGTRIADPIYLAYTNFAANTDNEIVLARVVINARNYDWQRGGFEGVGPEINGRREVNLDTVMLHEIGHALGIDHSDKNPGAIVGASRVNDLPTMNSVILPGAETLHLDDESAARFLYLKAEPVQQPLVLSASPLSGPAPLDVSFDQFGGDDRTVWDFGDGTIEMGAKPAHRFVAPGTYTVFAASNGRVGKLTIEVESRGKNKKDKPAGPQRKRGKTKRAKYSDALPASTTASAGTQRHRE